MDARSRVVRWRSPPLVLAALWIGFGSSEAIRAGLVLPELLPDQSRWVAHELPRWAFPAAALWALGWWRDAGVLAPPRWRGLPMPWIPALSVLAALWAVPRAGPDALVGALSVALAVSVYEEALFRGLVLRAALPWGAPAAVGVSSALFGLWHLGAMRPENWFVVAIGTFAGVGLGAMRLRGGSIWPGVLWHAGYNLPPYLGSSPGEALPADPLVQVMAKLAPALVLFAYGAVLVRARPEALEA